MGLAPEQVLDMSMHDYQAALHFYAKAQSGGEDDDAPLDDDAFDEMMVGLAAHEARAVH